MNRDEPATDDTPSNSTGDSTGDRFESLLALYDQALVEQALASDTSGEAVSTQPPDQPLEPRLARAQQCLRLLYGRWPEARASEDARNAVEPARPLTFGRFQIERELGRGGYGVVYLAHDPVLRREIALKLPRPEVLAGSDAHQRFVREGQTAARLHHPNLVTVLEAGEVGPVCYLAMEYCPGPTLSAWRKSQSQPIAPRQAAELLLPLAEAVGYLHTQDVVHRDIKPGNVLLEQTPHPNPLPKGEGAGSNGTRSVPTTFPKLTDFGLAKSVASDTQHTRTGSHLGTPAYMAPELAGGTNPAIGPPADVYSLGVMLYELLAGMNPFAAATEVETYRRHLHLDPPGLRTANKSMPRDMEAICLKCLEKSPSRRYATASALADDLRRFLAGEATRARPLSLLEQVGRLRRQRPVAVAVAATALVLVFALLATSTAFSLALLRLNSMAEQRTHDVEQYHYATTVHKLARELSLGEIENAAEIYHHDRMLSGRQDLQGFEWRLLGRQLEAAPLDSALLVRSTRYCAFSPDGKWLATGHNSGEVRLYSLATGKIENSVTIQKKVVRGLAYFPDGRSLAVAYNCEPPRVYLLDADQLVVRDTWEGPKDGITAINISPNGSLLAIGGVAEPNKAEVRVVDLAQRETQSVSLDALSVSAIAFSRTDNRHLMCGLSLEPKRTDTISVLYMDPLRQHVRVNRHRGECCSVIFHPDRKSIISAGVHGDIVVWDRSTGAEVYRLSPETGIPASMALRADGKQLWVGGADPVNRNHVLPIRRWTWSRFNASADVGRVRWGAHSLATSPDGGRLAIITSENELLLWPDTARYSPGYFLAHHDGAKKKECWGVAFSADGKTIASAGDDHNVFVRDFPGLRKRHDLAPDMGGHKSLASCIALDATGKHCASGDYDNQVKLWDAQAGKLLATLEGHTGFVRCVAFSPDGKRLASGAKDQRLCIWDVATHKLIKSWEGFGDAVRGVAYSPDGKWLAACSLDYTVALLDAATLAERDRFTEDDKLSAVAFTPNSKELAYASEAGQVFVREVPSGNLVHTLLTDNEHLLTVAVSPDGATIAAGGVNKTVYFWHRQTGHELLRFDNLAGQVNCLAFDPQGNTLVAALHDGSIALWEALPAREP